jgi:hypothetical protein
VDKQVQSGYFRTPPKPIFKRMVGRLGYLVGIVLGKANGSSLVNKTVGSLPLRNLQRVLLKRFAAASFKADLNWNSLQGLRYLNLPK